ncbi:dpkA [Symbiodinium sp. KB8]|nr:dpkA [Symbiodinium sp. KB8]
MEEQGETTVSIRGIGTTNTEAVQVTVDRSSPLSDIKKVLADLYDRPEIAADGQFLKQMPNGATVKMHDAQKIGTRKELLYEGPPLAVVSEAIPLTNLDEFDGFDEKVDVLSPRSLRALDLQGVSPDELYYAPAECFWEPDLDRRIMQLHHDFVEAWRQDTLSMCRAQRRRILEQDVAADSELDKSTRDWMASINCSSKQDDAVDRSSLSLAAMPRFLNTSGSPEEQIAGTGGHWAGILEPHVYPLTCQFFEDLQYWMQLEKVLERSHPGLPPHARAESQPSKGPPAPAVAADRKKVSGKTAKEAVEEVERQRRRSSKQRHQALQYVVEDVESMIGVASAQRQRVHGHIQEVNSWRDHREACSQESRGPWQNQAQERNFTSAYRRCDSWHARREAVHQAQIRAEEARYEATVKLAERDVEVKKRVGRMRDMAKVKFSRQWIERRSRWLRGHAMAGKTNDAFKDAEKFVLAGLTSAEDWGRGESEVISRQIIVIVENSCKSPQKGKDSCCGDKDAFLVVGYRCANARLSAKRLHGFISWALQQAGLNETAAAAITANITRAEQDGCKSHGLFRLPGYCSSLRSGKVRGDVLPEVRSLAPSCALADARGGFSTPACLAGHPMLVEKAKETGVAVLLISRAHHFAALWQDVEPLAAQHGLVAMAFLNSKAFVAHWPGGRQPLYGTNPMAFACPRRAEDGLSEEPFVFDQATSMMARGEMTLASMDGRAIPSDAAVDEHGQPTTDAAAGLRGAQLPFAGHKGTCLALMIELLAASFTGDAFAYEVRDDPATGPTQHGEFILAVDPQTCSKAGGRAAFLDRVEALLRTVEAEAKAAEADGRSMRLPAQRRWAARKTTPQEGFDIDEELLGKCKALCE